MNTTLKKWLEDAKSNMSLAEPVITYLNIRCDDDPGLAKDLKNKTWKGCEQYIYDHARKMIAGCAGAVKDETVYEWAEDFVRLKEEPKPKKPEVKAKVSTTVPKVEKPKTVKKPAKNKTEHKKITITMDQLKLF